VKIFENTLKIDYSGRNFNIVEKGKKKLPMESVVRTSITQFFFVVEHYPNVGFTKCKVKRVFNLFEDTGSVRELTGLFCNLSLNNYPIVMLVKHWSLLNYNDFSIFGIS
jgi:hypothetical protein